eukprot:PhM_4_TR9814/c2_g1_i3/m.34966
MQGHLLHADELRNLKYFVAGCIIATLALGLLKLLSELKESAKQNFSDDVRQLRQAHEELVKAVHDSQAAMQGHLLHELEEYARENTILCKRLPKLLKLGKELHMLRDTVPSPGTSSDVGTLVHAHRQQTCLLSMFRFQRRRPHRRRYGLHLASQKAT